MTIVTVDHRRAGNAVPCLVRAFWVYPETLHLLPSERARRRVLPRYLSSDVHDAARVGRVDVAMEGDAVVGAAAWLPPSAYPVTWRRQVREVVRLAPIAPWGVPALVEARRGQAANRAHHRSRPPHHWLRAIGVESSRHGTGIGSTLLRYGLEKADRDGVGCFLFTATEENAAWYATFGFEETATYRPTPSWPMTWALWRPPQAR